MPKYKLTDDATGMSVVVNSDNGLTEQGVQSTLAEARKQAAKSIETGRYKLDPKTNEELSSEAANDKLRRYAGYSMGVKPEEMDVDSGASLWERTKINLLRDDSSRMEYLEKKYGAENVSAMNVGGTAKMFYRDPKSKKMTMVDEMGASLADFTADIAGDVLPTAAAVGGAIGAVALTGATGGLAVPLIAAGGAALGGFGGGVAQDVASEVATGQDVDLGDIAAQRRSEALLGAGFDVATLGAGRFIGKPLMKAVGKTQRAQSIMDSLSSLQKKFDSSVEELPSMTKGEKALEVSARRAGETGGALTRVRQRNIDEIGRISRVVAGEEPPLEASAAIQRTQDWIRGKYADDVAQAESISPEIANIYKGKQAFKQAELQAQLDNELAGMRLPRDFDPEVQANSFRDALRAQESLVKRASGEKFNTALSGMEGVGVSASKLSQSLGKAVDDLAGIVDIDNQIVSSLSPSRATQLGRGVKALDKLAERGESVSFRALHNLKQSLDSKSGYGAATPSKEQLIAREAASKVRGLMDNTLNTVGSKGAAYKEANKFFQDRILPFRTKQVRPLIDPDVAAETFKMSGEKLAKNAVSDPETVRQILRNSGGLKPVIKKQLGNMYLDAIGSKVDQFNPRIASQLFGSDVVSSMNRIKTLKKQLNTSEEIISGNDLEAMVNGLSGQSRRDAEELLKKKMKAEARLSKKIKANGLISKIATGKAPLPSDPRSFAREVLKESPESIDGFVKRLEKFDPDAASDFKQGVVAEFKGRINFGGSLSQKTSLNAGEVGLWNPGDVEKFLKGTDGIKYKKAMGDDWIKDWIDLDRALSGSKITGTAIKEQVRAVFTTGSGLLIVAAGVPKWAYGRAMNALHGSRLLRPFLKNVQQDPEVMTRLIPYLIGTSEGMQALINEGQNDPEFAEWLDAELAKSGNEQE